MAESSQVVLFWLHISNLLLSAYLAQYLVFSYFQKRFGSFSRSTRLMVVAVLAFLVVEVVQVFKLFSGTESEFVQSFFTLLFLALLLLLAREIVKNAHAHDHLVKRKLRMRMSDVE